MPEPAGEEAWAAALDAMELHLDEIRAGLAVASLPPPYEVGVPDGPMPLELTRRALRLLAAQRDLEEALRERMAVLSSVLSSGFEATPAPEPVYVDQRG